MIQKLSPELSACFYILDKSPESIDLQNENLECFINTINTVLTEESVYLEAATLKRKMYNFHKHYFLEDIFLSYLCLISQNKVITVPGKQNQFKYLPSCDFQYFMCVFQSLVSPESRSPQAYFQGYMRFP